MVNFTECQLKWVPLDKTLNASWFEKYSYNGSVLGITPNRSTQITLEGCRKLCGEGNDLYPWSQWSGTLTTWIFPIIGIILQAPFVSNAFRETMRTLARWIGNPIASLSLTLWNIKVTGRSAMIVDLAVPYGSELSDDQARNFDSIRDSFFLLNVMNQYTMRQGIREMREAEGLLRIVLFSKDIRLLREDVVPLTGSLDDESDSVSVSGLCYAQTCPRSRRYEDEGQLNKERRKLARELRTWRRRGIVPVYISTAWFIFSLGLSIKSAFGLQGQQTQAHDLALGLLLSWLPVFILSSIVDRNPMAAEEIRDKLNRLIDRVRISLTDKRVRTMYFDSINSMEKPKMQMWVLKVNEASSKLENFFVDFAGQARIRWHYGCCHSIVRNMERAYLAKRGREWLDAEEEARTQLVLATDRKSRLDSFDKRMRIQILGAFTIVWFTVMPAFFLSWAVPTVGIGCRSGGYLIFLTIATFTFLLEMVFWWLIHEQKLNFERHNERLNSFGSLLYYSTAVVISTCTPHYIIGPLLSPYREVHQWWQEMGYQAKVDRILFVPMEITNSAWLLYITIAQTFGTYQNCGCLTSSWNGKNYMDLTQWATTKSDLTHLSWLLSTIVSVSVMGLAMFYIVAEWLLQSHMNTLDQTRAARGLRRTRRFRRFTRFIREVGIGGIQNLPQQTSNIIWTKSRRSSRVDTNMLEQGRAAGTGFLPDITISGAIEMEDYIVDQGRYDSDTDKNSEDESRKPSPGPGSNVEQYGPQRPDEAHLRMRIRNYTADAEDH